MPDYTELIPEDTSAVAIESDAYDYIKFWVPEWEPSDADPTVWIIKTFSGVISQLFEVVADVSDEIFADFGENLMGIARQEASSAQGVSTWSLVDDAGHTIPAGQTVQVPNGDDPITFRTATEVVVPLGESTAEVTLVAEEPGSRGNGLSGQAQLVDALFFVNQIEIEAETSGGTDAETMDEYKPRLRELLQLMSPRPIIPEHFEILARQDDEVARAVAIPGLVPGPPATYDNALTMAVAVMKEDGLPLLSGGRERVEAALKKDTPINSVVHVIDANYTFIDVEVAVASLPEYEHAVVQDAVRAQLTNYFKPINWGRREGWGMVPTTWVNTETVRLYEVVEVVNRTVGVDYIISLKLAKGGETRLAADLTIEGPVPLTRPGTFLVS